MMPKIMIPDHYIDKRLMDNLSDIKFDTLDTNLMYGMLYATDHILIHQIELER